MTEKSELQDQNQPDQSGVDAIAGIETCIEFECQAREAKKLKDKITLFKRAASEYKRHNDRYACDVCITAAYSAIEEGDYKSALDCYLEAGKISYEMGSDDISWYLESWWIARKLERLEEVTAGIEKMLERMRKKAGDGETKNSLISYYRAVSKYALKKNSFKEYTEYVEKICDLLAGTSTPSENIALEYSLAAYNLRAALPSTAVEFFKKSIELNEKSDYPESKDLIPKLHMDCELTARLMKFNLGINPDLHPVVLEFMFESKSIDPYNSLPAMEKAAYNARQELKYMKFMEAERLYVILAETYLLKLDIDKSIKSYMRAVESVESLIYFKDVSLKEIPDAIERCTNYHLICGKLEAARQNYFLSTEHFYNAGESASSVQKYESALKYYQKALDCTSRTPIPMENWDSQRREVYKDIILAMENARKLIKG